MIGCVFLFMFWPSFNGILGVGMSQHRAVVNTVLSITASTLSSVYVSRWICEGKIEMEVLLNATLAGGVMMGAACDLIVHPGFAMLAGAIAGVVSAIGFLKLNKICNDKIGLHDTCGV
jgi:ammonium transporter Rh